MADDNVIQFPGTPEEMRWAAGPARCLNCKHEWEAAAPIGTLWLLCPQCDSSKGRFQLPHMHSGYHYVCECENDLFAILDDGTTYCPNCGQVHDFS